MGLFEEIAARGRFGRFTRETPANVQEQIRHIGGVNLFGQPNYIVEWGWNHLEWSGGEWTNRDSNGILINRRVELRFAPMARKKNRWHVFKWQSAGEFAGPMGCTPELWNRQHTIKINGIEVQELGPFPHRGWYVDFFTIEERKFDSITRQWSNSGYYAPLTTEIVRRIIKAVLDDRAVSYAERLRIRAAEKQAEEKALADEAGEMFNEAAIPAHTLTPRRSEHLLADFYRNKRIAEERAQTTVIQ